MTTPFKSEAERGTVQTLCGVRVLVCSPDGPILAAERDANDLISLAWEQDCALIALPTMRLDPAFFRLSTGLAGAIIQKFVNCQLRLAILGDFSSSTAASSPLRDFVRESNRGAAVWFLADLAELTARLETYS